MSGGLLGALAIALVVSGVGAGLVAWAGPLDRPRERGLHTGAVATSGGVAILAGVGAGLWALARAISVGRQSDFADIPWFVLGVALALSTLMGLLGALDDLWDFGARTKLIAHAMGALAFASLMTRIEAIPLGVTVLAVGPVVGALGTALWIVVLANAVNFMDGANGLAAGSIAIASAAFGVAALASGAHALAAGALVLAAAQLGFLPWNLAGRLFQGDAGALFSSTLLACLAVMGARSSIPLWTAPLACLPLLTDVLLTLLDRALRRRPLFEAHREHLYQRWLTATGKPHAALAWRVWLVMALYGAAALGLTRLGAGSQALGFAAAVVVSALGWAALRRRYAAEP